MLCRRVTHEGAEHHKPFSLGEANLTAARRDIPVRGEIRLVLVVDADRQPLDPCHPARARQLLRRGRAAVLRRFPFTIILRERAAAETVTHAHRIKLDPGSRSTGIAVIQEGTNRVVWAAELTHRGQQIRDALLSRRAVRRSRRNRKTRYRQARFENRRRPDGWLPPSLESRIANNLTWVRRLTRLCPVTAIALELVKFDTQLMQDAEISGNLYQQGELQGYEVREYLLEKWGRKCAYCGKTGIALEIEHITPRARGGSDRVSNLTLACRTCNQEKGDMTAAEYGQFKGRDFTGIAEQAKAPLKDTAAVNSTRWALHSRLQSLDLPLETGSGGRTKFNRIRLGLPKAHWTDAACVGSSTPAYLSTHSVSPLFIRATGHGNRQICGTDRFGFPIRHRERARSFLGFRTGDLVRAVVPAGKYAGTHTGRVAIRFRPSFRLGKFDVHPRHLTVLHRADGFDYTTDQAAIHPSNEFEG